MQVFQHRVLYFVNALDLPHQQFGIADYLERFVSVLHRIFQRRDQRLVLGEVVGLVAEVLAQRRNLVAGFVLDHYPVARGPGIAPRAAVRVGDQVMRGSIHTRATK